MTYSYQGSMRPQRINNCRVSESEDIDGDSFAAIVMMCTSKVK